MTRTERVLALLGEDMTAEEARARGITLQDADDAVSLLRLDLELTRASRRPSMRAVVAEWLREFDRDD